jgi:hypothetical protein
MTMLKGALPELHGHCVDGAATRVTITTSTASDGDLVWQVGGQLAERGVAMEPPALLVHAREELAAALAVADTRIFNEVRWATYRIDRAESATRGGIRPDDAQCITDGPPGAITLWPTKLALAPRAAERVIELFGTLGIRGSGRAEFHHGPRPEVGLPPWEGASWRQLP